MMIISMMIYIYIYICIYIYIYIYIYFFFFFVCFFKISYKKQIRWHAEVPPACCNKAVSSRLQCSFVFVCVEYLLPKAVTTKLYPPDFNAASYSYVSNIYCPKQLLNKSVSSRLQCSFVFVCVEYIYIYIYIYCFRKHVHSIYFNYIWYASRKRWIAACGQPWKGNIWRHAAFVLGCLIEAWW